MRIAIIRNGRLGDILMILPAIKLIRAINPDAEIYCYTSNDGERLLKNLSDLKIKTLVFKKFFKRYWLKRDLKHLKPNKIFCFESNKKYHKISHHDFIFIAPNLKNNIHYSEKCLQLIDHKINYEHLKNIPTINLPKNNNTPYKHIGFHLTYSGWQSLKNKKQHQHRAWPINKFADLAEMLDKFEKFKIYVNLMPNEYQILLPQLAMLKKYNVNIIVSTANFGNYINYINNLDLLITGNTGVMHLAAATHTPVIGLFSNMDPQDCGPWLPTNKYKVICANDKISGLSSIAPITVFNNIFDLI